MNTIIHSILLPLEKITLLLPSTAVAEIIALPNVEPLDSPCKALLGVLNWRGIKIPVLCLEALSEERGCNLSVTSQIAVFNMKVFDANMDFCAIVLHGKACLKKVTEEQLVPEQERPNPWYLIKAKYLSEVVFMPNLQWLCTQISLCSEELKK